jgi:carboxyl-terminal processing protease
VDFSGSSVPVEPVIVGPTRAERPATWLAATLVLVLVFAVGVLLGQSGALGGLPGGSTSGATNTPTPGSPGPSGATAGPTDQITNSTTDCATGAYSAGAPQEPAEAPADFDLFWQALACIRQNYVGRADLIDKDVTYGAINGMVEALGDTGHSVFLTPEALASEQQSLSGTVEGIGALLGTKDGQPIIVSVITGGPANAAGMKAGDIIISVDDVKVAGMNPGDVATKIRGPAGTQVTVVVLRPSTSEQLTFNMTRAKVDFPVASWAFVPGTHIADLRLIQFSSGAADDLRKARDEAIAQGAAGFILDLRSNPGGFVPEAVNTASLFLHDKTVYVRELADHERIPVQSNNDYPATDLPTVMLIDAGTASSAEIVSAAIKSAQRGDLVGETTYGTGTVLLTFNLTDGSAVRIAVERWLTPDGDLIFGKGIAPTVEVALPTTASPLEPDQLAAIPSDQVQTMEDSQMLKGIQILQAAGVP